MYYIYILKSQRSNKWYAVDIGIVKDDDFVLVKTKQTRKTR